MNKQTLYLMVGYPGSGKTTTSKIIQELTGAVHLWADHERQQMFTNPEHSHQENITLYDELNRRTDELLRSGKSVIFDTNFNFYKDREHLRRIAARNGVHAMVIWITTPEDIARERATKQSDNQTTRVWGNMPLKDFNRIARNLQKPKQDEHVLTLDGSQITKAYVSKELHEHSRTHQA
jgi:predicted kinase